jgi:hypothetical protein
MERLASRTLPADKTLSCRDPSSAVEELTGLSTMIEGVKIFVSMAG